MQNFKLILRFYSENYPEVNWKKYSIKIIARKVRRLKRDRQCQHLVAKALLLIFIGKPVITF